MKSMPIISELCTAPCMDSPNEEEVMTYVESFMKNVLPNELRDLIREKSIIFKSRHTVVGASKRIDAISTKRLTHPVMVGVDGLGRPFITLRMRQTCLTGSLTRTDKVGTRQSKIVAETVYIGEPSARYWLSGRSTYLLGMSVSESEISINTLIQLLKNGVVEVEPKLEVVKIIHKYRFELV